MTLDDYSDWVYSVPQDQDKSGYVYAEYGSVLGYGGIVLGTDGVSKPLPEHQAITGAIPEWVKLADHQEDTLRNCLRFATHEHASVRAVSLWAFGELARHYGRLAEQKRVVAAIELGIRDRDNDVRDAAVRSADVIEEALGWRIARPVV